MASYSTYTCDSDFSIAIHHEEATNSVKIQMQDGCVLSVTELWGLMNDLKNQNSQSLLVGLSEFIRKDCLDLFQLHNPDSCINLCFESGYTKYPLLEVVMDPMQGCLNVTLKEGEKRVYKLSRENFLGCLDAMAEFMATQNSYKLRPVDELLLRFNRCFGLDGGKISRAAVRTLVANREWIEANVISFGEIHTLEWVHDSSNCF